ncbi:peptide/nickel transport system substrate-binding protein/oligopeptide transport system substrate-binding protein [Motilibacter rhizosphaerae]|uniref:Peptide/nickel transport system substrate-binding protein/oligopeptide transport system substrate-binding protein n=1 Tax=Motilibacter rhizosphaerae TaxID=598652 RepID=A0A4Q7NVG0_9ACTN|nr:ABC transporter substrate-binding protein [Motilibacter rhizosphaerae]RZS90950.1 peptide/nickel transport system substrate-binding protein/oligopeptide transport system substrate-binding protein [Motilibacter rhizosphaerae]
MPLLRRPAHHVVLAVSALALAAPAAVVTAQGSAAAAVPTVSIAVPRPEIDLAPGNVRDDESDLVASLFTGLVRYDAAGRPVKTDLAQSITTTDERTWTIRLRPGWTFSNGEPVTAQSFIDGWNYVAFGPHEQQDAYEFAEIVGADRLMSAHPASAMSGLRRTGPLSFTVTLTRPDSSFVSALGAAAFDPMPQVALAHPAQWAVAPVGDGPFQLQGHLTGTSTSLTVVRNPHYRGKAKPTIARIVFTFPSSGRFTDLSADVVSSGVTSAVADISTTFDARHRTTRSGTYGFLAFPAFDPAYADVHVRRAIGMAIDRQALVRDIFGTDRARPADDFVTAAVPGYRSGGCGSACTHDPASAAAEWAAAASRPSTVVLNYNADGGHKPWIAAVCGQVTQALGVPCTGRATPDFPTLVNDADAARKSGSGFGPLRLGWLMDYPSALDFLEPLYSSTGLSNYGGYSDPGFDALLAQGRAARAPAAQLRAYRAADDVLATDVPVLPVYVRQEVTVWHPRVRTVPVDVFGRIDTVGLRLS